MNLIYLHLNRVIKSLDLSVLFVAGPGHGAPGVIASTWLEGTYSETYPDISRDLDGMRRLFRQFSFPGGIPSHAAPDTPSSIHEGGELGYSLSHAYGAVLDNPGLIAACVVGDGEAETGPLAASWRSNRFIDPATDGAVLPILHLNGWKIADPALMHQAMAAAMDREMATIAAIQAAARSGAGALRPRWPMIVLRSPKGWTGPKFVDGKKTEGSWRSHQVPIADMEQPGHLALLETWMQSYRPAELFDTDGRLNRTPDGYAPTQAGEGVRAHAERLEAEAVSLERAVGGRDVRMAGLVRVTCAESVATHILAPCLASLHSKQPDIMLELIPNPRELSLSMREADISVRLKQTDQHDLVVRRVGTIAFGLYASPGYLRDRGDVDFADGCAGHHLITQSEDIEDATQTNWLSERAPRARVAMQTSSHEAAVVAAIHDGGLACLARFRADRERGLLRLSFPPPVPTAAIWLVVAPRQPPDAEDPSAPDPHHRACPPDGPRASPDTRSALERVTLPTALRQSSTTDYSPTAP